MTTAFSTYGPRAAALTNAVGALKPQSAEQIALVSFMMGALYSLHRSLELDFDDRRMTPDLATARAEQIEVLKLLSAGQTLPPQWLSGYYIDSAMLRVDALGDRLGKLLGRTRPLGPEVPAAVNSMKHDIDAGIAIGGKARLDHIVRDMETLLPLLEQAMA